MVMILKNVLMPVAWNGLTTRGYSFDLQLASYILNPSLKDEIKSCLRVIINTIDCVI